MQYWTHDELHALMDNSHSLKARSDKVHTLPQNNSEEKEHSKLQMMGIYAEATNCQKVNNAKEFIRNAFSRMRLGGTLDELRKEYASQKLCHSPLGNDYTCFCDNKTA